jgi:hypothetical protein
MESLKDAMDWIGHVGRVLRDAYDKIMSVHTNNQFEGIRELKAAIDDIDGTVKHQMGKYANARAQKMAESAARVDSDVAEASDEYEECVVEQDAPPIPPVQSMPKMERYRVPAMRRIGQVNIYKEMCAAILESLQTGQRVDVDDVVKAMMTISGMAKNTAEKYCSGYIQHFIETDAFHYLGYIEGRKLYRYRGDNRGALGWMPVTAPNPVTVNTPYTHGQRFPGRGVKLDDPKTKRTPLGDETPIDTINGVQIYESRCMSIRRSLLKGEVINRNNIETALVKMGYARSTAEAYAPSYITHFLIEKDKTLHDCGQENGMNIYRVLRGMVSVESEPMSPEEAARRAEEERRVHTDMMGGAH